jgi:hypothetical protein
MIDPSSRERPCALEIYTQVGEQAPQRAFPRPFSLDMDAYLEPLRLAFKDWHTIDEPVESFPFEPEED